MKTMLTFLFIISSLTAAQSLKLELRSELKLFSNFVQEFSYVNYEEVISPKYSAFNITGQFLAGSAGAILLTLPAASGFSLGGNDGENLARLFLVSSTYLTGAALGVWMIGKIENEKLSFWNVLSSSLFGGGVGFIAYTAVGNEFYIPLLAGPILGAMVYTLFISD